MSTIRNSASIGAVIARAREAKGLNQSELAREIGVSPQAVQKWEAGSSSPRPSKVAQIAQVLGIEPMALLPVPFAGEADGAEFSGSGQWPFRVSLSRVLRMDQDELERIDDFIEQSVKRWEGRSRPREASTPTTSGVAGSRRLHGQHKKTG